MKFLKVASIVILSLSSWGKEARSEWMAIPGLADPSVLVDSDGRAYLSGTYGNGKTIKIFRSDSTGPSAFRDWATYDPSQVDPNFNYCNVWAPSVSKKRGVYYVTFTASRFSKVGTCTDQPRTFTTSGAALNQLGTPAPTPFPCAENALNDPSCARIDSSFAFDANNWWFSYVWFTGTGNAIATQDLINGGGVIRNVDQDPSAAYEQGIIEAPEIFRNAENGFSYLFFTTGNCCTNPGHYKVHYIYSRSPADLKRNFGVPELTPVQLTFPAYSATGDLLTTRGHSSTVKWGNNYYLFYHKAAGFDGNLYRDTFYEVLNFRPDGSIDPFWGQLRAEAVQAKPFKRVNLTNRCLDNPNGSTAPGTPVKQWDCNGYDPQKWDWIKVDATSFLLRNKQSGLCMDVASWSKSAGAAINQWHCRGTPNQLFRKTSISGTSFRIQNVHSGLCAHVSNNEMGAALIQSTCSASTSWSN